MGTPQSEDVLVYQDAKNPQRFHTLETTDDERFAVLTVSDRGQGKDGNALFMRDLSARATALLADRLDHRRRRRMASSTTPARS